MGEFFRQALELIESVVGRDHLRVAQELGALSRIARKIGHQEEADSLQRREIAIANRSSTIASVGFPSCFSTAQM